MAEALTGKDEQARRIAELRRELAELRASLPAHSTKPSMFARLEEIEDELSELLARQAQRGAP